MSDVMEMPSASVDDVMSWKPCWIRKYGPEQARERIAGLWANRERLTLREALDLPISDEEIAWLFDWMCETAEHRLLWQEANNRAWEAWSPNTMSNFTTHLIAAVRALLESQPVPTP